MSERILAVIPCLNEERTIGALAEQLATTNSDLSMRIIITDGGSRDRTPQIAQDLAKRHPNISFLYNPKRLQAAALNLAVSTYGDGAEFLIRIDAHADYPDDYCRVLLDEAVKTGADAVVVAMNTAGKGWFQKAVAAAQNSLLGNGGSAHRNIGGDGMWVDHGHHALMRVEAFRVVEGYDESFSHNEDAELDARLRRAGFKIWLTGKTALTYYPRSSPVALFAQYMRHGYGRARTILKHHAKPKLRQLAPAAVLPAALLALFTPFSWMAALPLFVWIAFCIYYGIILARRANDPALAVAGPAAMIMHFGWSIGFWRAFVETLWQ